MWTIANETVNRGEKKQVYFIPNGLETHKIPATLICGAKEGETLCLLAGTHSGEYPSIPATIQFAKEVNPSEITGQIVVIHCLNSLGFWESSDALVPDDGMNLNSSFPGNKEGSSGEKIIDFLATEIFPHIDFLLDMHSGGKPEKLAPCLFWSSIAEEEVVAKTKAAAIALDFEYLIIGTSRQSLFGYAALQGIPNLLVERGEFGTCRKEDIANYKKDIIQLMKHLKMIDGELEEVTKGEFYTKNTYFSSDVEGIWYPEIEVEQKLKKGDVLGHVEDMFGNHIKTYYAEYDSVVYYYYADMPVKEGTFLVAYGAIA